MNAMQTSPSDTARFELRFQSLFHEGRGLAFPCDETGHVDLDSLSHALRTNYLFARTLIGRDFSMPAITGRTIQ
jgi:hypothetical protein